MQNFYKTTGFSVINVALVVALSAWGCGGDNDSNADGDAAVDAVADAAEEVSSDTEVPDVPAQDQTATDSDCDGVCAQCAKDSDCKENQYCTGNNTCEDLKVLTTSPAAGDTNAAIDTLVTINFPTAMDAASIKVQKNTLESCSDTEHTIHLSGDDFTTCFPMNCKLGDDNKVLSCSLPMFLSFGREYKLRVTQGVKSASGKALAEAHEATFTIEKPSAKICDPSVVIYAVDEGGKKIILHNRYEKGISSAKKWSLQYRSKGEETWRVELLEEGSSGNFSIGARAYKEFTISAWPKIDQGSVVLVSDSNPVTGCNDSDIVDKIGFGDTDCSEGAVLDQLQEGKVAVRKDRGCRDTNNNSKDFELVAKKDFSVSRTSDAYCSCGNNGSDEDTKIKKCSLDETMKEISVSAEANLTDLKGFVETTSINITGQVGWGPLDVNPSTQCGFLYTDAERKETIGNKSTFKGDIHVPKKVGFYRLVYRFSIDNGKTYTYCDLDGAGKEASFDVEKLGKLIVTK